LGCHIDVLVASDLNQLEHPVAMGGQFGGDAPFTGMSAVLLHLSLTKTKLTEPATQDIDDCFRGDGIGNHTLTLEANEG